MKNRVKIEKENVPVTLPLQKMSEVADEFPAAYLFKKGSYSYNRRENGDKSLTLKKSEVMCMEQFIILFTEYADVICVTLSVMTVIMTGITLHKLKKLERQLYTPKKEAEILPPREEEIPQPAEKEPVAETPEVSYVSEQEKLLDAVLGEVFP